MENPFEKLYLSVKFNNIYRRSVQGPARLLVAKELGKPNHRLMHLTHDEPGETIPDVNPTEAQRHILSQLSNEREVTPASNTTKDEKAILVSSDSSVSEDDEGDDDVSEAEICSSPVIHSYGETTSEECSEKTLSQCSKGDVEEKWFDKLSPDITDDEKPQKTDTKVNTSKRRPSLREPTAAECRSTVTQMTTSDVLKGTTKNFKGFRKRTTPLKAKSDKDQKKKKQRTVNREGESEDDMDINFVKEDFTGMTVKSLSSNHLAHLNIMPLSEALQKVNVPLRVKPQSLFGFEGIINNRNMKWQTIVDEG